MENEMKRRRTALMKEKRESNPDNFARKKLIFYLLSGMVILRFIYAAMYLTYCSIRGISLSTFEIIMVLFMVVVGLVVFWLIYRAGLKWAAYLALFGGVYSLYNAYNVHMFSYLNISDAFWDMTNIVLLIAIFIQLSVALFIIFDKKCKLYLRTMSEIQNKLTNEFLPQNNRLD